MNEPWIHLASGGDLALARYDILAEDPLTIIEGRGFDAIARWLAEHRLDYDGPLPFVGGLVGCIDYGWPDPQIWLMAPRKITIWDRVEQRGWQVRTRYGAECRVEIEEAPFPPLKIRGGRGSYDECRNPSQPPLILRGGDLNWTPTISKRDYIACVQKILHHIREGDIYQANLAQTFTAPFTGDAFAFWQILFQRNPAPFFAYIDAGRHQVLSTSPELLLRQRGNHVESRPIKGTRPRGHTASEDAALCAELLANEKEGAELAMIVDLVRNDLHRSCVTGSVHVDHHRVIEAYQNVFHQISIVTGQLASPHTSLATLQHLFPGGSITGCPKIRAMEIIDELEGRPRGIYTGSIGYASLHGTQDWNIAIRTAVVQDGKIDLSVGGGIVADSDPEAEYAETLHKAATFFEGYSPRSIT